MNERTLDSVGLRGVSVLVVEDAWPVAKALKGLLERLGMNVLGPAATTAEARRLLAEVSPVVALVDVNLRGEMAWGLIDDLHEQGVEMVVISGYPLVGDPHGRPLCCLQKPYETTELIGALHSIVAKRKGRSN